MLEDVLASQVTFKGYHRTYFPYPGFVATGITMRRKSAPNLPPLGYVETIVVEGRWSDLILLRQRVQLVDITGLHIVVPPIGSRENHEDFPPGSGKDFDGPETMIERFVVHESLLDIMRTNGNRFSFPIKQLEIKNLHKGEAMTYAVDLKNAIPTGRILAQGSLGPINAKALASTPVTGSFVFTQVNLHDVGEISGMLDARGAFKGTLQAMEVEASTDTKDFAVTDGKPTPVDGSMRCTLSGLNGDMDIHAINLRIGETNIQVEGSTKGAPKITNLDISVERGRTEDVMRPFVQNDVPISGLVWLKSHAYVGPPGDGFMARLRLNGSFEVPAEKLTNVKTEKSLSAFSERAQGDKPTEEAKDALSSLEGPVKVENGVASSPRLTFKIPGATATLGGTFRFHGEEVHLTGDLKMDTDISHTTTGFKSFLLKPLAPFFKTKNAGSVVPIAVTGKPGNYKVTQNLTRSK